MEKVESPAKKLGDNAKWLQSARTRMKKKGTVGLFGRGVLGEEARFAANAGKRK